MSLRASIVVLLLAGCAWSVDAAPQRPRKPPSPAPAASTPAPEDARAALVARLAPRVARLRGLEFKRPVAVKLADPATLRRHFERRLRHGTSDEEERAEEAAYAHLGLLPPKTSLVTGLIDTLEDQARGYYDPESDTFYLVDGSPEPLAEAVVAHELTHALDDQHFSIDALAEAADDTDSSLALAALLEGSATLVMARYLAEEIAAGRLPADVHQQIRQHEGPALERLQGSAPLFQRTLTAPYVLGLTFLTRGDPGRLRRGFDTAEIDRAFREPPRSTEQVLHPAKYWDPAQRDLPQPVHLPDLRRQLGPKFVLQGRGRLGELLMGVLVGAPTPDAREGLDPARWDAPAAAGSRGDEWQHYSDGTHSFTAHVSVWDNQSEAQEFLQALRPVAHRRAYRFEGQVLLLAGDLEERMDALAPLALGGLGAKGKP